MEVRRVEDSMVSPLKTAYDRDEIVLPAQNKKIVDERISIISQTSIRRMINVANVLPISFPSAP